jgi:hypothetical protein
MSQQRRDFFDDLNTLIYHFSEVVKKRKIISLKPLKSRIKKKKKIKLEYFPDYDLLERLIKIKK